MERKMMFSRDGGQAAGQASFRLLDLSKHLEEMRDNQGTVYGKTIADRGKSQIKGPKV